MSDVPVIRKQQNPAVTSKQIKAAIVTLRQYFPDDAELAKVSDAEIEQRVGKFLKSEEVFTPALRTPSAERMAALAAVQDTCEYAIAVVIIDVIGLILGFVGLRPANWPLIASVVAMDIARVVAEDPPKWQKLIDAIIKAGSPIAIAKAIFDLVKAAYDAGMFRHIFAEIKSSMTTMDWIIFGVAAVLALAALVLTDGAAFIAEVVLNALAIEHVVSDSVKAVEACR